jgi:subtilisin family serine protease
VPAPCRLVTRRHGICSGGPRAGTQTAALALGILALAACDRDAPTVAPSASPRAEVAESTDEPFDTSYIAPIEAAGDDFGYYVTGTVIARFKPGASAARVAAAHGASVKRAMFLARTVVLNVPAGRERAVAQALARNPNVEFAEPDYLMDVLPCEVGTCSAPSDPFMGYKWDLHNAGSVVNTVGTLLGGTGAADADIDWLEAFDYLGTSFAGAAKIGIIDTGIYPDHVDLAGRVIAARNFATGYPSTLVQDRDGHGTHVAGIAGARGHNGAGLSGVAYGANIALINAKACEKYLFADGSIKLSCPSSSTADAIVWATDQGANVLNMSFGGDPAATAGFSSHQAALRYARAKNVLPFCAAGNENYPGIAFPARFPECVAVGATTWSDTRASYSNYGAKLELSAPGGDETPSTIPYSLILSTGSGGATQYAARAGTSMATPQAAGLAALLYATGITNAADVLARLQSTADDLGPQGRDDEFGFGRINAYRAITQTNPNDPPVVVAGEPYAGDEGSAVDFDGSASSDPNGRPLTYAWSFGDGGTATGPTPTHTYADNGDYTVTLTVADESGLTTTTTIPAVITNVAPAGTLATSAAGGRVVVGTPVSLSFADVTDASPADVAAGISRTYSCTAAGDTFTASPTCATPAVGTLGVRGMVTDKDGSATVYGPEAIAIEPAATVVTVQDVSGQYSDKASISASLSTDAGPGVATSPTGTMEFFVDGVSVGTQHVMGTGVVTQPITLSHAASSHALTARFTSADANYTSSALSNSATLTVGAESATLTYAATNAVARRVTSPGGTAPAFSLVVSVAEAEPDAPALPAVDAWPGDINLAPVSMVLVPVGQGSSVAGTCTGGAGASGYAAKLYTCSFAAGVPVNTYAVQMSVGATPAGTYYVGGTEDVLTVYDPSLGFASGGGSFAWPGSGERTTFGFTIKYTNGSSNPQGSLLVVRHTADGTTYRLKSNALEGLALSPPAATTGYATFSGKATYLEPGWANAKGNTTFMAYVQDNDEPGAGTDGVWLQVSGGMSVASPANSNVQPLTGGNVVVPHSGQ